jgi:hypothetical protein
MVGVQGNNDPYRWTTETGAVDLGGFPNQLLNYGNVWDLTVNGSVVVGLSSGPDFAEAYRWNEDSGMVSLGLPVGVTGAGARGCNWDGSVIAGWAFFDGHADAFRWTEQTGIISIGAGTDEANAVSADGQVIVGRGPFRWTAETGAIQLQPYAGDAWDVSSDGAVIVGETNDGFAFIWNAEKGMRHLKDVLESDYGLDLQGWFLNDARGISADGLTIVGQAAPPGGGPSQAYRVRILQPESLAAQGAGQLATTFFDKGTQPVDLRLDHESGGELTAQRIACEDLPPDAESALEDHMVAGLYGQLWDFEYTGEWNQANITFTYDESSVVMAGLDEADLQIYHYVDGAWVGDGVVDVEAHTITIETDSFSPFVLGTVPGATVFADIDADGDVDGADFRVFASCYNGANRPPRSLGCSSEEAQAFDSDDDGDVDGTDFTVFATCFNRAGNPPRCAP